MAISATTLALIGAGVAAAGATGGAIGSAANNRKAREEELRSYQNAKDYLNSLYYRDPLTTVGNQSLLKQAKKNYEDNLEALQNRAVAGGATMENALAARQANNENLDKIYTTLLQGEDARRDRIGMQQMQLDQQHSQSVQGGFRQAAMDWQAWGSQMGKAGMSLMNAGLLGGGSSVPGAAGDLADDALAGMASRTDWEMSGLNQGVKGLNPVQEIKINNASNGGVISGPPNVGGLAGPGRDLSKTAVGNPMPLFSKNY